jgi:phosphate transport system protein
VNRFDEAQLGGIRDAVVIMACIVERQLVLAIEALEKRDDTLADHVEAEDTDVDQYEMVIDNMVITYMATHAPIATDCRLVVAASKIASNLERIGDQATSIARRARELSREPQLKPYIDIRLMAEAAGKMLRNGITAFVESKADLAREVISNDCHVDDINRQLDRELTSYMIEDPKTISRCLKLMIVSKCLERVADHAQNIAEEAYYVSRGEDIRHGRHNVEGKAAS